MTFILTNDDGIDAEGIYALQDALNGDTKIIAPSKQYSGCGHQITAKIPIKVTQKDNNAYAIDGTPVDCVRLAICELCPEATWVLAGINAGGNLGVDTYQSGTVAAVREAAILGLPAIAISHVIKSPLKINWQWATTITTKVIDFLLTRKIPSGCFWNVNLPHLPETSPEPQMIFCPPSIDSLPVNFKKEGNQYHYQGKYHDRKRTNNTDVDICFSGNIAISLMSLHCRYSQFEMD
jgi:5'-nucleotidase